MLNQNLDASSAAGQVAMRGASQFSPEYSLAEPLREDGLSWRSAAARYHAHAANLNRARGRSPSNFLKQPFFLPERRYEVQRLRPWAMPSLSSKACGSK
jgi:hypothetical protein